MDNAPTGIPRPSLTPEEIAAYRAAGRAMIDNAPTLAYALGPGTSVHAVPSVVPFSGTARIALMSAYVPAPATTDDAPVSVHAPAESAGAAETPVAEPEAKDDRINLKVVGQDAGEVFFTIRKTTPFGRLFKAYSEKKGVQLNSVRFLFDGQRLTDDQTPEKMQMSNGDVIDALLQQTGGK